MSRIVTVYSPQLRGVASTEMAPIRWHRISAALAALGHTVHIASAELRRRWSGPAAMDASGVSIVPITRVDWASYDMVKTLFHLGFETVERYGGSHHPLIVSKLGSVVAAEDRAGIYFYGRQRKRLYGVQQRMSETSRFVTLLSQPAIDLWRECFGEDQRTLLVPGAVDAVVPAPVRDPYVPYGGIRCVFSGNFYRRTSGSQPEAHQSLSRRLNRLGEELSRRGARLYVVGPGDHRSLDARHVTYMGAVPYEASWDYLYFATVGIVVAAGGFMHNNESTKIYHYLRAGLPVVSEAGFPNDNVVRESGLGTVVENDRPEAMAEAAIASANRSWDRDRAVRYIMENHTWDRRVQVYDRLLNAGTRAGPGPDR